MWSGQIGGLSVRLPRRENLRKTHRGALPTPQITLFSATPLRFALISSPTDWATAQGSNGASSLFGAQSLNRIDGCGAHRGQQTGEDRDQGKYGGDRGEPY